MHRRMHKHQTATIISHSLQEGATKNYVLEPFSVKFNSLPHNPNFWEPFIKSLLRTLWEIQKTMLVSSIVSFSQNVFHPIKDNKSSFLATLNLSSVNASNLVQPKIVDDSQTSFNSLNDTGLCFVEKINYRTVESEKQNQTACMWRLILLYTLCEIRLW